MNKEYFADFMDLDFLSEKEGLVKLDGGAKCRLLDDGIEVSDIIVTYAGTEGEKEFEPSSKDYDVLEEIFSDLANAYYKHWY